MRWWSSLFVIAVFIVGYTIASPSEGSIYYNGATKTYSFVPTLDQQKSITYGTFEDSLATDGFPTLNIHSVQDSPVDDAVVGLDFIF